MRSVSLALVAALVLAATPAPASAQAPTLVRAADGLLYVAPSEPNTIIRYTLDGSEPTHDAGAWLAAVEVPRGGRRIAVLGDMLELGPEAAALHRGLAEAVDRNGVDLTRTGPVVPRPSPPRTRIRRDGVRVVASPLAMLPGVDHGPALRLDLHPTTGGIVYVARELELRELRVLLELDGEEAARVLGVVVAAAARAASRTY